MPPATGIPFSGAVYVILQVCNVPAWTSLSGKTVATPGFLVVTAVCTGDREGALSSEQADTVVNSNRDKQIDNALDMDIYARN